MEKKKQTQKLAKNETYVKVDMSYEQAMKKALNTPLPKKGEQKKKAK